MSVNYTPNIGELCHEGALRDAMHFAVAPVVAHHRLDPGTDVAVTEGRAYSIIRDRGAVGIVDPFLQKEVEEGEQFWLFLYPNTITGLRHMWTHPAFKTKAPNVGKE